MRQCKLLILLLTFLWNFSMGQNVGINATGALPNNSAMLDVASSNKGVSFPNVSLTSQTDAVTVPTPMTGLMVYNTNATMPCGAGLYFNNGTSAAPIWVCFSKTKLDLHAYDNAGRTGVLSTAITQQPGCLINFTIPTGQIADVKIDAFLGGSNVSTTAGAYSVFDAIIYVDGAPLAQGGWSRVSIVNPSGTNTNSFGSATLSSWVAGLTAGAHTIQLMSRTPFLTATSAVTLGGNCTTVTNCGEIHALVFYR